VAGIVASGPDGPRLEADDPRLPGRILLTDLAGAAEGESVVAEITVYPVRPGDPLQARVTHRLGSPLDPRNEVAKILIVEEVRDEYGAEALAQAESAPADPGPADLADRADLRDVPFITIDPGDARDFDDAVAVADAADGGWRLDVAVADVSHYVRPGSPIDVEASLRTLSLYLPNRAIHMLPARLSSGICSLAPDRDRLAVVVRLGVSAEGQITDEEVVLAVIRSQARLDYEGVAAVMSGGHDHTGPGDAWVETLTRLTAMASALHRARIARGGLDFDLPEAKVVLDEDDPLAVRDVCQAKPTEAVRQAYRLIEECMVAANESVGRFCAARRLPVIWRVHDAPSGDRFTAFVDLANAVGVPLRRRAKPTPITIQNVLTKLAGHRVAGPLQTALLRCLAQAVYGAANIGHFALAAPAYLHFTSPIRRYPDLLTHRAVKHALTGHGDRGPLRSEVAAIALRCTEAERHSVSVERAVVDLYRAFVMREHLGETFAGVITSVAAFGMFVQIPAPFVEGLLPREALGFDRWDVTEDGASLRGQRTGRTYTVGDRLDVRVAEASIPRRQVAFALATPPEPEDPRAALLRRPAPTPPRWPRHQRGPGRRGR
jgi:ribonuclease R